MTNLFAKRSRAFAILAKAREHVRKNGERPRTLREHVRHAREHVANTFAMFANVFANCSPFSRTGSRTVRPFREHVRHLFASGSPSSPVVCQRCFCCYMIVSVGCFFNTDRTVCWNSTDYTDQSVNQSVYENPKGNLFIPYRPVCQSVCR